MKLIDVTGQKFNRLTVIGRDKSSSSRKTKWVCKCDCGNMTIVDSYSLRNGTIKSCGCWRVDRSTTHHQTKTRLYNIWTAMRNRCYDTNHKQFKNYGGRGISVCEEWKTAGGGFERFWQWSLENGYAYNLTIDRINNVGNYCPDNCRWITHKKQQNNRTNNRYITSKGETKTISEWSEEYGIRFPILKHRLDVLNLPLEVAISMDGLTYVLYDRKRISVRRLAQIKHIDYKLLLHAVLVDKEDVERAVSRLENLKKFETINGKDMEQG